MLPRTKRNMLKFAVRNKLPDTIIRMIIAGTATKAIVYGYVLGRHPTKRRKTNGRKNHR